MKAALSVCATLIISLQINAQTPEDALRMSWNVPSGSARHQAIGGAMGSLGGDITSIFVNPAGLGFYKTGEVVLTPGISLLKGKSSFRGTDAATDRLNRFNFGTSGIVWGHGTPNSQWSGRAFSLAINRTANFNNVTRYEGVNDYSSFTEPLANEFFDYYVDRKTSNPQLTDAQIIDDALDEPNLSLLSKMALYTYLVDIDSANGQSTIVSRAEQAGILSQSNLIESKGGITEIALGFAANMDDKIYLGASLGVPIVNYERTTSYTEESATGADDEFNSSLYNETFTSKGVGINAKLGLIFKPVDYVRLGIGIHTPTLYGLKDNLSSTLRADLNSGTDEVASSVFNEGLDPEFRYDIRSPWKFLLSASYVLREVQDVTQQRGFLTADVEYVGYGGSRFASGDEFISDDAFDEINKTVKDIYKGAFNFRAGGELKFNTIMARAGFAWYGNPYEDKQLKARRMNISGGLGYRNRGMFIDLTYVHAMNRDVNFPYRVDAPRENTFAELREGNGNVLVTLGFKF
jgi:hypothetical protein